MSDRQDAVSINAVQSELSVFDHHAEVAKEYARNARSTATRRAYASDLADFERYCRAHGLEFLPAQSATVACYIADLAGKRKTATVQRRLSAIARNHQLFGFPSPTRDSIVYDVMHGIRRAHGSAPHKKTALTVELLTEAAGRLRDGLRGRRDRALLLVTFAGAFRRSEVAALDVADLKFDRRGVVITVRRSKTDQAGAGREVAIPYVRSESLCPVLALQGWLEAAGIVDGAVFRTFSMAGALQTNRIDGRLVARLVQRLMVGAGIDGDFAAHSLRAGFITSGAERDIPEVSLQSVSGHQSVEILRGYVRRATLFDDAPLRKIMDDA